MSTALKLLLLEDSTADAELIKKILQRAGIEFKAVIASDEEEFHRALDDNGYHAVLADNALPQYSSLEALKLIRATNPHVAFILVTGTVSEEFAVNIIQQGADDYILKSNLTRLPAAIQNAIGKRRVQREKEVAEKETAKEKELFVSIINSLPGIFYICDSGGKFLRWNRNFERISGYAGEEIKKMNTEYFFAGIGKDQLLKFMKKSFATGHGELEANFVTREGKMIPYYFTTMAVSFENKDCLISVGLDITASKEGEEELQLLNQQLRDLSARLHQVREEEQHRIARELHDELGQQITGLKMDVSWLQRKLDGNNDKTIKERLAAMIELLDEAVKSVRKIASELRPSILDDMGLLAALDWQSKEFEKRFSIPVHLSSNRDSIELAPELAIGIFRAYQESLTNIARHAQATAVTCQLDLQPGQLRLSITDNGKGFDMGQIRGKGSLGLVGMKERVLMMNGTLQIESFQGKGTVILITVPLE